MKSVLNSLSSLANYKGALSLLVFLLYIGVGNVRGYEMTYTFNSSSWQTTGQGYWTSGANGAGFTANQGVQITTGASGANATSPRSFTNISKIVVKYCTNTKSGVGTIKVKVGSGTEKSFSVTKPSSNGTTLKNATFNFSPAETGTVKVTGECTTNSVFIYSVTITYSTEVSGSTYTLLTDVDDLLEDEDIIIVEATDNYAMSKTQNTNNRGQTNSDFCFVGPQTIKVTGSTYIQTLMLGKSNDHWTFYTGSGYLYAASSSNNYLKTQTTNNANGEWTISLNGSYQATITAQGTNTHNLLQHNSGSSIFSCYGSAQQAIKIFHCTDPRVDTSPASLETFTYAVGYGPSLVQALTVKGYYLTGNLTVSCPDGYEISTNPASSGYGASNLTLTRDANNKVNTTVYIRLSAGKSVGSYNKTMSISGGGITTTNVSLTGSVITVPSGTAYKIVTDHKDIFPDDETVVLNASGTHALSTTQNSNNRAAVAAAGQFTYAGSAVFVSGSSVQNIVIQNSEDEWNFKVGDNSYLYAAASSNNYLRSGASVGVNGEWQVRLSETSIATVTAPQSSNRSLVQYNKSSTLFSCYAAEQTDGAVRFYAKPSATANVCGSPSSLSGFSTTYGAGASAAQSFSVKARNITSGNVTVSAPTGYEVCTTENGIYTASLTLTPSDNKVAPTTLWVRLKSDNEAATYNGNIAITATGATTRNIALSGTVDPDPVITLAATSSVPLVTSRNGINIMATNTLTLNIRGARAGQTVSISGTGLKFYKNDGTHYVDLSSTALTAPVTNQVVYVSYNPTSDGTGAIATPSITVTCDNGSETFNSLVKARNIPAAVAIVANVNGVWQALPANMSSAQNPEAVTVNVKTEGGIQKAYGPSTLAYKLWPVKTTNGSGDRFGTYSSPTALFADRVRLTGNSDAALWANDNISANTIRNWAVVDEVTDNADAAYEWKITTTEVGGEFVYNLQTAHGTNNYYLRYWPAASEGPKWGTYANGVNNLYILPLTEVTEANISVMEWGTNKMTVSYPNGGSCTAMTASINNGSPTAVTINSLGGDIYELTGVGNLQGNPAKTLVLTATEGGTKQKMLSIPYIITSDDVAEATIRTAVGDAARLTDIVVRSGGKLTTGSADGKFKDLYIYPGGKAKITNNLVVRNIYMRGGYSFLNYSDKTYAYPDLCVNSGTITTVGVKYDLYVDNRYYYMFSMPYDVALEDVTDETGSEDFPVWVKHYNGAARASGTHVSGWEWYGDEDGQGSFFAGVGYEITAKPRVSGRPVAIIRFPVISGNVTTDASHAPTVAIHGYGRSGYSSGSVMANNVGWNFLGNPYLTEYKAVSDTAKMVAGGFRQHEEDGRWDGTYDWVESVARFLTVPMDTENDYTHEWVGNYTIPAFSTFFFQYSATDDGTFTMGGTRPQASVAPRFGSAPKTKPELHIDVLLNGDGEAVTGKAGLFIHDKYDGSLKDFEDVEQWFVEQNALKTYTFAGGTALAFNLMDEQTATQQIPLGYIATIAGEHTYSINEENDVSGLDHLWLTDSETGETTDLLARDYTFTTAAGRFDERFILSAVLAKEEVITDIKDIGDSDWAKTIGVYHDGKILTLRGLPENSAVYIFDMTGKLIVSREQLHNVASFNLATQGVYNIRVVSGDRAVTLRSVSR